MSMMKRIVNYTLILLLSCGNRPNNSSLVNSIEIRDTLRISVGKAPGSVEIGDFNHDKIPDLAITSEMDSSVTILLGNGKGNFTEAKHSPFFAGSLPNDLTIGDFDKDLNADLAIANHEKKFLTVLLGDGKGSFNAASNSPFRTEGIPHVHGVATGDFNNDGRPDLVTDSWGNDHVEIIFGDSTKLFKTPGVFVKTGKRPYQRLRVADLNGDQVPDIVTTNTEGNNVSILLADGKGGFQEAKGSPFPCGDAPFGIAAGDINGDGKTDLAVINSPASMGAGKGKNGLTVLVGDGSGNFSTINGSPFEAGRIPNRIAVGDVNGDSINDIVTSDNGSNKIYLFLMGKGQRVLSTRVITVGNAPKGIAIADLNKDGLGDIVVCNNSDNNISIIFGSN